MTASPADRAIRPVGCEFYFLPVRTRVPLRSGPEVLTEVICARVRVIVQDRWGRAAPGWGETPLSVQWVWPSPLPYGRRLDALQRVCLLLTRAWADFDHYGHPLEVGHEFQTVILPKVVEQATDRDVIPYLAALVCCSAFDLALHDAYGNLHQVDIYNTYTRDWLSRDLGSYFNDPKFAGEYPADYLRKPQKTLTAWHMVGGLDPITSADLRGDEPEDGFPVTLEQWVDRDRLQALKIKLRGNDYAWDRARLIAVGELALGKHVPSLSADFNCMAGSVEYVNALVDDLTVSRPDISQLLRYIEQPFPYDLPANPFDVRSISKRKPLYLDESAHDWQMVKLGHSLGWSGVALKTCKTQSGAILSLCWARRHQMGLMVQDLTNPMLATIPHVRLAAHAGTLFGVEVNACQFYPEASFPEQRVHPGIYQRCDGAVDLSTIGMTGFGYRVGEISRTLPAPAAASGELSGH